MCNLTKATLRLFNGVIIENLTYSIDKDAIQYCMENGVLFDYRIKADKEFLETVTELYGIGGSKMNSTFRKNWKVIEKSSHSELIFHQLIHYITTYGFEQLGVFDHDRVYLPNDKFDCPDVDISKIPFSFIKAIKKKELVDKIKTLASGMALSDIVLDDIMCIVEECRIDFSDLKDVKNRELASRLQSYFNVTPTDPDAFLRYMISELTGQSLVIKNNITIEALKNCNASLLSKLIDEAPKNLASIFLRNKPLFLAMKKAAKKKDKTFFNRLRKQAKTLHKPVPVDVLGTLTSVIKKGQNIDGDILKYLEKSNVFRKIRAANALNFRLQLPTAIVYKVRNGKGYAQDFSFDLDKKKIIRLNAGIELLKMYIKKQLEDNFKDKTFYIPNGIVYGLPATEKQFAGNLPNGSYITLPKKSLVGIHWYNADNHRVDLDLSSLGVSGKIGWDANHKSSDVMFSGDITDAPKPNGAAEYMRYTGGAQKPSLLLVNYFNYMEDYPVTAKIIVANSNKKTPKKHIIDPNHIIAHANIEIDKKETVIGLVVSVSGENRFYFSQTSVGNNITSGMSEVSRQTRDFLAQSLTSVLSFNDLILDCGGIIVDEKPEDGDYIDLSPENLTKESFIGFLTSGE